MGFIKTHEHLSQQGQANPKPNYAQDGGGAMVGDLQAQIRIGGGSTEDGILYAANSNLMGANDGQEVQVATTGQGVGKAEMGVSIKDAAPMKRVVVSKTTAAAQHLAAKRWGFK